MKNQKKDKKKARNVSSFSPAEVAALIEDFRSEFRAFGEKLQGMDDKLDSSMGMIAKNREDITMLNLHIPGIKSEITKINGKLAKIEEDIRIIKSDVSKRLTRLEANI